MFHHFYKSTEKELFKGSFTELEFEKLIEYIGLNNIVSPSQFLNNIQEGSKAKKCCITFDDGLKSQKDIALPLLKKYNIKAFWFIYTAVFEKNTSDNEVYKYLINKYYSSYDLFVLELKKKLYDTYPNKNYIFDDVHDNHIKFFTLAEREHRFIRDKFLNNYEYNILIKKIFSKKYDLSRIKKELFLNKEDLNYLIDNGHCIGLHSHSHPMNITKLNYKEQLLEYSKCQKELKLLTNYQSKCMSHPNNYYNNNTLKVLKELGVQFGFHSQNFGKMNSHLEIPRIDCSYLR